MTAYRERMLAGHFAGETKETHTAPAVPAAEPEAAPYTEPVPDEADDGNGTPVEEEADGQGEDPGPTFETARYTSPGWTFSGSDDSSG